MGITVATTRVACNLAAGNQDITTADLGGLTPKATFFIVTQATSDGVVAANAVIGIGAATATDERWACSTASQDSVGTTNTNRRATDDECVLKIQTNASTVDGEADFVTFIANGVRINWSDAPAAPYLLTIALFAGTDLSAQAEVFTLGDEDVEINVNTVGFEPDVLLTGTHNWTFEDTGASHFFISHGLVLNKEPVEQYCYAYREVDTGAVSGPSGRISDAYGIMQVEFDGSIRWGGEFSNFDAQGFSCTARLADSAGDQVGFLALAFNGAVSFEGNIIDSPIANGNQAVNDPGFTPQYVHVGLTQFQAVNTSYADDQAGSLGISTFDLDDEHCNSIQIEDNQAITDTQSLSDDTVINLPDDDGSVGWVASFVSFDVNGWTWNFTSSHGTAVKWWYLAIETELASTTTTTTVSTTSTSTVSTTSTTTTTTSTLSTTTTLAPELCPTEGGVTVAVTRTRTLNTAAYQTITNPDLGGQIPKAALFIVSYGRLGDNPADNAVIGIGAATSVGLGEQWAAGVSSQHNVGTTRTRHRGTDDECIMILDPATNNVDGEANFVTFVNNGVTILWGDAPSARFYLAVIFFAGADLLARAGTFAPNPVQNGTTNVNEPGFTPDLLLIASHGDQFNDTSAAPAALSFGAVLRDAAAIEQACYSWFSLDGQATSQVGCFASELYCAGAAPWGAEITSFGATGFTCTTRLGATGGDEIGYLALAFHSAVEVSLDMITSPTVIGNRAWTDPGFQPQFVLLGLTQLTQLEVTAVDATAGSVGVSAFDSTREYCNSIQDEDAQGTTDTQSLSENDAVNFPLDSGAAGHIATFVSFDETGFTFNFTATQGTAKYWWAVAIGA